MSISIGQFIFRIGRSPLKHTKWFVGRYGDEISFGKTLYVCGLSFSFGRMYERRA